MRHAHADRTVVGTSSVSHKLVDRISYDFWGSMVRHVSNILQQDELCAFQGRREDERIGLR